MYDYMVHERSNWERQHELIREAQEMRRVQAAKRYHQPVNKFIATPIRRAAHLVAALIH